MYEYYDSLDKEFLRDSSVNVRGRKVIRNIIAMCLDLKIDVVTEGVETQEQVNFITKCGCQTAQGFFYSRPIPVEEFMKFAEEHISDVRSNFTFRFNGNLKPENGDIEAEFVGAVPEFHKGIFANSKSLYFPGGDVENNVVEIPPEILAGRRFYRRNDEENNRIKRYKMAML